MALTPVEIHHVNLGRGFRGYKRAHVDRLLAEVASSFEDVWRDRADLTDRVEVLEADLVRHKGSKGCSDDARLGRGRGPAAPRAGSP